MLIENKMAKSKNRIKIKKYDRQMKIINIEIICISTMNEITVLTKK